jgi:hypothetical protein
MSGFVRGSPLLRPLRRQEQDLRATLPPVADLAASFPVAPHVFFTEQVLAFTHSNVLSLRTPSL